MSDGWQSYYGISEIDNGLFSRDVIIHEDNFVHPYNDGINTQNVEEMLSHLKCMFKRMRGTSERLLDSYLAEFMCRSDYLIMFIVFLFALLSNIRPKLKKNILCVVIMSWRYLVFAFY
jgi:hypothetical protein